MKHLLPLSAAVVLALSSTACSNQAVSSAPQTASSSSVQPSSAPSSAPQSSVASASSMQPVTSASASTTTPTSSVTTPAATSAASSSAKGLPFGQQFTRAEFNVAVLAYDAARQAGPQEVRQAVQVKVCIGSGSNARPAHVSWSPWTLIGSDSERYSRASSFWPNPEYPLYPHDELLQPGECAKGWIEFEGTKKASLVKYTFTNSSGAQETVQWLVP